MRASTILEPRFSGAKLENAILSAALTFFAFFALILSSDAAQTPAWFDGRPYGFGFDYDYLEDPLNLLFFVGLFAVPLAIWHAADLCSKVESEDAAFSIFDSYLPVLGCYLGGMLGSAIILSGLPAWLSCWRPEPLVRTASGNEFGFYCTPNSAYLIDFLVYPFLLAVLVLSIIKVVMVLRRSVM